MTEQKFQLVFFLLQYFIQAFSVFRWWDRICPLLKRLVSPHKWISGFGENLFSSDLFFHFDVSTLHSKTYTCSPLEPCDWEEWVRSSNIVETFGSWNLGFCKSSQLDCQNHLFLRYEEEKGLRAVLILSHLVRTEMRKTEQGIWGNLASIPTLSVPPVVPISEFWSRSPFEFRRRGNWTKEASVSVSQEVRRQERHGRTQEVSQEVSCPLLPV